MGFFNKIIDRFTSKAGDKIADKAIDKIFGKSKITTQNSNTSDATNNNSTVNLPNQSTPTMDDTAKVMSEMQKAQITAMMTSQINKGNNPGTEMLKYMKFNDDMEWIGVTPDAPDYVQMAYKNSLKNK